MRMRKYGCHRRRRWFVVAVCTHTKTSGYTSDDRDESLAVKEDAAGRGEGGANEYGWRATRSKWAVQLLADAHIAGQTRWHTPPESVVKFKENEALHGADRHDFGIE